MRSKVPSLGDVVLLKSGSPLFVVVELYNNSREAKVAYWKDDSPSFFKIETVALIRNETGKPKAKRSST